MTKQQVDYHIVFMCDADALFSDLAAGLKKQGAFLSWVRTCEAAAEIVLQNEADLVIVDETVGGKDGLDCIDTLVAVNPRVNCAAVSPLAAEVFHEKSEGLGILMQLPPEPGGWVAGLLLEKLSTLYQLIQGV
jgi:response regulator RpfG family c-di-GMP phosphodiesterase